MLQVRFPTFRVMQEDGWAGLRDLNGNIMQESLFALRENLLWISRKARPNVLVSLTQAAPDGGDSLLVSAVKTPERSPRYHCATGRPMHGSMHTVSKC
ncbi:hypothetical protein LQQ74_26165 (plasmid) [Escherichia coli]|nr:hypothetical protein LQQ74_26165 [Escherichia coli]